MPLVLGWPVLTSDRDEQKPAFKAKEMRLVVRKGIWPRRTAMQSNFDIQSCVMCCFTPLPRDYLRLCQHCLPQGRGVKPLVTIACETLSPEHASYLKVLRSVFAQGTDAALPF